MTKQNKLMADAQDTIAEGMDNVHKDITEMLQQLAERRGILPDEWQALEESLDSCKTVINICIALSHLGKREAIRLQGDINDTTSTAE